MYIYIYHTWQPGRLFMSQCNGARGLGAFARVAWIVAALVKAPGGSVLLWEIQALTNKMHQTPYLQVAMSLLVVNSKCSRSFCIC